MGERAVRKIRVWTQPFLLWLLSEQQRLILDSILLGVIGALTARLFTVMLDFARTIFLIKVANFVPLGLASEGGSPVQLIGQNGLWLIPLVTTLGGLLSGILVYTFAPEAEGHGTDTVVSAFHYVNGRIRARVPLVKIVASAITLGSGGAAGREGPTALTAAGISSIYANFTHRTDNERRLLLLVGEAAGLSAIFRSPIGTAVFATEVLYGNIEFESVGLLYTMLSSVVAYAINGLFVGYQPLFLVGHLSPPGFGSYFWYILLGVTSGLIATVFPSIFYYLRDIFQDIPIPAQVKPAIGGLGVGIIALQLPQVLGGGYGWLQAAIDAKLSAEQMLVLSFGMMLALSLTISSGGSGGVFAPSLFIGGMAGGFIGSVFHESIPAFVVVGMAATFSGAARVPIASLLMVIEMTGGYTLLAPAALSVMLSYFIQQTLTRRVKYKSLYEAQVPFRSDSPAHYEEEIESVFNLLKQKEFKVTSTISPLSLESLITSGIPIDLPDKRQVMIIHVDTNSSLIDEPISSVYNLANRNEMEVIGLLRNKHMYFPHPNLVLRTNDRLLVIVSPKGKERLAQKLTGV